MRLRRFVCSALVAATTACGAGGDLAGPAPDRGDPNSHQLPITRLRGDSLALTSYGGLHDAERVTVRDDAAWRSAWAAIWSGLRPTPPLPAVDFGREVVVVAALGQRGSGGFSIRIDSAATNGAGATVWVHTISPGQTCGTTQALTQPVDAVRIPLVTGTVEFREVTDVANCR